MESTNIWWDFKFLNVTTIVIKFDLNIRMEMARLVLGDTNMNWWWHISHIASINANHKEENVLSNIEIKCELHKRKGKVQKAGVFHSRCQLWHFYLLGKTKCQLGTHSLHHPLHLISGCLSLFLKNSLTIKGHLCHAIGNLNILSKSPSW